jgi:hypothetical protein
MHAVSVGDLSRGEAERRHDAPNAPNPGDEPEPFQIGERGTRLSAGSIDA